MDVPPENKTEVPAAKAPPTASDLFSSAKVVGGAAQACFQGGTDEINKGKVAGAAADLLGAASDYGKLEDKGYGEYVEKAETYLEQYSSGGSAAAPATKPAAAPAPAAAATDSSSTAGGEAKSEGGVEGALKMAKGALNW